MWIATRSEAVGEYSIEYSGVQLEEDGGWVPYVAVYGPSSNPMHRNSIFPLQRVSVENVFDTEAAAEEEARRVAYALVENRA